MPTKKYTFLVRVEGYGENEEEAWDSASESYCKGVGHHFPQGPKDPNVQIENIEDLP